MQSVPQILTELFELVLSVVLLCEGKQFFQSAHVQLLQLRIAFYGLNDGFVATPDDPHVVFEIVLLNLFLSLERIQDHFPCWFLVFNVSNRPYYINALGLYIVLKQLLELLIPEVDEDIVERVRVLGLGDRSVLFQHLGKVRMIVLLEAHIEVAMLNREYSTISFCNPLDHWFLFRRTKSTRVLRASFSFPSRLWLRRSSR